MTARRDELRIAVAMTGGVSLCVWMGGVARELARLAQKEGIYADLLDHTQTEPLLDVVSGTSAGGLNGAFLSTALVHGTSLAPLRDLWIEMGSLTSLLRDPLGEPHPPSILRGDDYFLPELRRVFRQLAGGVLKPTDAAPMDLTLMTTQLVGRENKLADDFGTVIVDVDHRVRFRFRRGPGVETDSFAENRIVDQLSLAARSSASFPVAFEASWIPLADDSTDGRPNMTVPAAGTMRSSGYVVDGAVLDNKPIEAALTGIHDQRAGGRFRRVLLYVVPDPGSTASMGGERESPPDLAAVAFASLVTIPRNETIVSALQDARDANRRVDEAIAARLALGSKLDGPRLETLACGIFDVYIAVRSDRSIRYIVDEISRGIAASKGIGLPYRGRRELLYACFKAVPLPWMPYNAPQHTWLTTPDDWRWGNRPVEEALLLATIALRWAASEGLGGATGFRHQWHQFYTVREALPGDAKRWRTAGSRLTSDEVLDADWAEARLREGNEKPVSLPEGLLFDEPAPTGDLPPNQVAAWLMRAAASIIRDVAETARSADCAQDDTGALLEILSPQNASLDDVIRRVLWFHVVASALGRDPETQGQVIEIMQLSASTPNPFKPAAEDAPAAAADAPDAAGKLAGTQLGNFGAFYKRSWRAHDWMRGRLDGAARMVQLVISPAALRRCHQSSIEAIDQLCDLAGAADPGPLQEHWVQHLDRLRAELEFLDDPENPLPDGVPVTVAAITRRVQAEIAAEELSTVARCAERDAEEGSRPESPSARFVERYRASTGDSSPIRQDTISIEHALTLLPECRIGEEGVFEHDMGTDRFAATVATTLAIATAAIGAEHGGPEHRGLGARGLAPLRVVLRLARAPVVLLYLLTRNGTTASAFSSTLTAMATTFGLTVVLLNLFTDGVRAFAPFGWVMLVASLLALTLRGRFLVVALGTLAVIGAGAAALAARSQGWEGTAHDALPFLAAGVYLWIVGGLPLRSLAPTRRRWRRSRAPDATPHGDGPATSG